MDTTQDGRGLQLSVACANYPWHAQNIPFTLTQLARPRILYGPKHIFYIRKERMTTSSFVSFRLFPWSLDGVKTRRDSAGETDRTLYGPKHVFLCRNGTNNHEQPLYVPLTPMPFGAGSTRSQSSHLDTASFFVRLPGESLFYRFFSICFVCVRVSRARHRGRSRRRRGCQRVLAGRGGLEGARSPFSSWLGVACASRDEGSMNGLCLASCCGVEYNMYESIGVVSDCKNIFKRCLCLRPS